jgi:hypothetical protein
MQSVWSHTLAPWSVENMQTMHDRDPANGLEEKLAYAEGHETSTHLVARREHRLAPPCAAPFRVHPEHRPPQRGAIELMESKMKMLILLAWIFFALAAGLFVMLPPLPLQEPKATATTSNHPEKTTLRMDKDGFYRVTRSGPGCVSRSTIRELDQKMKYLIDDSAAIERAIYRTFAANECIWLKEGRRVMIESSGWGSMCWRPEGDDQCYYVSVIVSTNLSD